MQGQGHRWGGQGQGQGHGVIYRRAKWEQKDVWDLNGERLSNYACGMKEETNESLTYITRKGPMEEEWAPGSILKFVNCCFKQKFPATIFYNLRPCMAIPRLEAGGGRTSADGTIDYVSPLRENIFSNIYAAFRRQNTIRRATYHSAVFLHFYDSE